jgi:hypothetical protein
VPRPLCVVVPPCHNVRMDTTPHHITALSPARYEDLTRGDHIGYLVTGRRMALAWHHAIVTANDLRAGLIVAQCDDGRIDTFEDGADELAHWPRPYSG